MKCDACGVESDLAAAFVKERKTFRKSVATYCPACWQRHRKKTAILPIIALVLVTIVSYVALWLSKCPDLERTMNIFFLIYLFFILSIVPHELGHAIAGWLLDFRVSGISFGYGKQPFKFQLFGTIFSFHRIPTAGLTRSAPKSTGWHRTRYFIKVLAGPAANAIIALTIIFISPYHGGVPNTAQLFLIANLLVVISTLLPYRDPISRWDSDGKNMIKAFSMKPKKIEQAHVLRFLLEAAIRWNHYRDIEGATEWCKKGLALYPDNLQLLDMTGLLCLDRGDYAKARELYTQLLQCDSRPSAWRFKLMNNIAYSDALMGDPSLLPEADAYSEEAYRNLPWADFAIGTRGTVLVEMGKYEDGINLLKESIAKCDDSRSRALNSCHLSVAYARLGDFNQADNYLKLGRQTDSRCSFLERAAAELQKHKENPLPHTTVARD